MKSLVEDLLEVNFSIAVYSNSKPFFCMYSEYGYLM